MDYKTNKEGNAKEPNLFGYEDKSNGIMED